MNKTYVFTDIHGQYDLWVQIKNYIDESDQLIFLGDAIDRGPDGIKIMREMLADPRITYLKGNHEDFLTRYTSPTNILLWTKANNGGRPTYEALLQLSEDERAELVTAIKELPLWAAYKNDKGQCFYLSHAGFTPEQDLYLDHYDLLWDRDHFDDQWPTEEEFKNTYIVHGHTPAIYVAHRRNELQLVDYDPGYASFGIYTYEHGHKICLDLGSADTKKIALYDLDEMKVEKYFYGQKEKDTQGSEEET